MPKPITQAALLAALLPAFYPVHLAAQDSEIHILCSNGFHAAMEKLVPPSEPAFGHPVKIQFGPSATFKHAIETGEAFDLAILSAQVIEDLTKEGKIAAGTGVDLASTGIGFAVRAGLPKPDVSTPQAIKRMLLDAKSIGYVKVGAGTPAILDMLNGLGVSQDLQSKTVFQPGADESMANVAAGKIAVALALISEILPSSGVQLAGPLPPEYQKRIVMSAGIATSAKNREVANQIIKKLTSPAAAPAIKAAGMDPITK